MDWGFPPLFLRPRAFAVVFNDDAYECLYDLEKNPTELMNLAANPEYTGVRKQLAKRLETYLSEYPKATGKKETHD